MKDRGEKTTYIVFVLAQKYNICERKVYDIITRFRKNCTLDAA